MGGTSKGKFMTCAPINGSGLFNDSTNMRIVVRTIPNPTNTVESLCMQNYHRGKLSKLGRTYLTAPRRVFVRLLPETIWRVPAFPLRRICRFPFRLGQFSQAEQTGDHTSNRPASDHDKRSDLGEPRRHTRAQPPARQASHRRHHPAGAPASPARHRSVRP
jgi:hypothetical protein